MAEPNGFAGATVSDLTLSPAQLYVLGLNAGWNRAQAVIAMAIAVAESSGKKGATNKNTNGSTDYGLWQINSIHGFDSARLLSDAQYNADCAYAVYKKQGWGAWAAWKSPNFFKALKGFDESAQRKAERDYGNGAITRETTNAANDAYQVADKAVDKLDYVGDFVGKLGKKSTWIDVGLVTLGGVMTAAAVLILAGEFMKKVPTPISAVTKGLSK